MYICTYDKYISRARENGRRDGKSAHHKKIHQKQEEGRDGCRETWTVGWRGRDRERATRRNKPTGMRSRNTGGK